MRLPLLPVLAAALLAPLASAQRIEPDILFSDFDDAPSTFQFGSDVPAVSIVPGEGEYATAAMRGTITPTGGGGGFAVTRTSAVDAAGAASVVFLVRSTVTDANASGGRDVVVLEVKLAQNGTEYVAYRELAPATGYQFLSIPLSAFLSGGASPDASAVTGFIFALGGVTGPDFTIDIENLGFATSPTVVFNDFDDGNFGNEDIFPFSQNPGGLTRSADGPGADGTPNALVLSYDGSATGAFAGVEFKTPGNGLVDASATQFFSFYYRDVDDGTAINILLIEPGGDLFTRTVTLPAGDGYQRVVLPLSSFADNPEGNGVLDQLQTVKIEIGDRGTGPSSLVIDQVTFRARRIPATQTLADGAGWRLLSPPVSGFTVGDLASQNLVQGIADSYPAGNTNVFTGYVGGGGAFRGYTPATSTADGLEPGDGFFWYLYDETGPAVSEKKPLPFTVFGLGEAATADVTVTQPLNADPAPSSFHMIGNPFDVPFLIGGISETTSGGTFQTSVSAWDADNPSGPTYVVREATDVAAVWQGFFAEVTGATADPTFVFSADARVDPAAPDFYGRTAPARLDFVLSGEIDGAPVADRAAVVRFVDDATAEWDRHDATKLYPLASRYALVAFEGVGPDGAARRQSVLSLPLSGTSETPLGLLATAEGTFTLSWDGAVPAGMTVELRDASTGASYDLSEPGSLSASATAGEWSSPLTLHASASSVGAEAPGALAESVGTPSPNPSAGAVRIPVQLAAAQTVRVTAYDVLGRRVAASESAQPAGASTVQADLGGLAPGVYVIRVEGAAFAASLRVTVAR